MRRRTTAPRNCLAALAIVLAMGAIGFAAEAAPTKVEAPGLGDPGTLTSITLETGREKGVATVLRGRDAQQQLLVTGHYSSGQQRDLTRQTTFHADPAGVVTVDSTGLVLPVTDGKAVITAETADGKKAALEVAVERFVNDVAVNFPNQVVPIFTKLAATAAAATARRAARTGFGSRCWASSRPRI